MPKTKQELLEQFAANAPDKIPDWFVGPDPKLPEIPRDLPGGLQELLKDVIAFGKHDSLEVTLYRHPMPHGQEARREKVYYLSGHRIEAFGDKVEAYWNAVVAARNKAIETRYFAWRWHYAEQMMKHQPKNEN